MEVASHAPGRFCFPEPNTNKFPGAKWFYGELLSWEAFDVPGAAFDVFELP